MVSYDSNSSRNRLENFADNISDSGSCASVDNFRNELPRLDNFPSATNRYQENQRDRISDNPEITDLERGLRNIHLEEYLEVLQNENIKPIHFKKGLSYKDLKDILDIPLGDAYLISNYFNSFE